MACVSCKQTSKMQQAIESPPTIESKTAIDSSVFSECFRRGEEAMQEGKNEEALVFFNKELKDNPQNGRAYTYIAGIRAKSKDYENALTSANLAIKYLPKEDKEYGSYAYVVRAAIYLNMSDTLKAIKDLSEAIKLDPEEPEYYDRRGRVYYEQKKYDLSVADYQKMIDLDPENITGYMGKAYIANEQKKWNEAIEILNDVIKLADDFSFGYSFRAGAYLGLKKWDEATDDIIKAISLSQDQSWDQEALYLIDNLKEPALSMLISKVKLHQILYPNEKKWPKLLYLLNKKTNNNAKPSL